MNSKITAKKGFSLLEMLVVMGILTLFIALVSDFQAKIFIYDEIFQGGNTTDLEALSVLKTMAAEMRSMSPSSAGAYPIDNAGTSTITFYDDINNDGSKEKIRYFLSGTTLERGLTYGSGNPVVYNPSSETITTLITNVRNASTTPIFSYYDDTYYGQASSTPLSYPLNIFSISLVNMNVIIDADPNKPLSPLNESTSVTIRNLKNNL